MGLPRRLFQFLPIWLGLLCLCLASTVSAQLESAHQILGHVYGSYSTACFQDADADNLTTTGVDADSVVGQKVLRITATVNMVANDVLVVDPGNANNREEVCIVNSVAAGVSVTCDDNLEFTHLGVDGDDVHLSNRVPIEDGALLTAGKRYSVSCHNGSGVGVDCECIMGNEDITATNTVGFSIQAGTRKIMKAAGTALVVSCNPAADDTYIDVCPTN